MSSKEQEKEAGMMVLLSLAPAVREEGLRVLKVCGRAKRQPAVAGCSKAAAAKRGKEQSFIYSPRGGGRRKPRTA